MTKEELNNSNVIRNIGFDESEIIRNILDLHCDGAETFDADFTASKLNFYKKRKGWKYKIAVPKYLYDVCPLKDDIVKINPFEKLPVEDGKFKSICIDLPFVVSPKTCKSMVDGSKSSITAKRFASWYPVKEGYYNMYWWLKEAERTLDKGGIIAYKMQNTVSGGIQHAFIPYAIACAESLGLYFVDEFVLEAKHRLISAGKIKKQKHARKYTSTWLVFKKDEKKGDKTNILNMLDEVRAMDNDGKLEGFVFELK